MEHFGAATGVFALTGVLVALPLFGAAVLLLAGRRADRWGHLLGCATVLAGFAIGLAQLFTMLGRPAAHRAFDQRLWTLLSSGRFHVDVGLLLDPLSVVFVLLITGVGGAIHLYAIGYMAHDPGRRRFFGYFNLFVAAMLLLVLADNYLVTYVGWEGVGLASYLLIGFWYGRPSAAVAAKKAFLVNRVGDVGLSLAIMLMFVTLGTTSYAGVFGGANRLSGTAATAIGLLLLLGACGKSAQFPLQTWLLDAMEGPTPVSALIHAATMVTAGVYLVVRSHAVFDQAPVARTIVAAAGAVTLMMGAVIGCAYDDIKKVLASSTMSQIGYMMLAAGLGPAGYAVAILHLLTHGFFKADMFLGAGSVMHAMDDEVDMRRYGGLGRVMPVTFATFAMGYLAIIGFPGWAGFWSKDKIIEAAFGMGGAEGLALGAVALAGVVLTSFYMTRLMVMTFLGHRRWAAHVHPHESPRVMTWPMIALAAGAAVSGGLLTLVGPGLLGFLAPATGRPAVVGAATLNAWVLGVLGVAAMLGGAVYGYLAFGRAEVPVSAPSQVTPFTVAARRNLYGDALNEALFMRPGQYLTRALVFFDSKGVDGLVNGTAAFIGGSSGRLRRVQTGFVRSYALVMLGGAAVLALAVAAVRL